MTTTISTRGRHLNHVAWLYDPVMERLSFGREQRFRVKTLTHMAVQRWENILDVGCGTGSLSLLVAEKLKDGGRIVGIDAAPKMIAIAQRKAAKSGLPAFFETGVAEKLQFVDSTFDCVVNSMFTHHVDSELKERAFAEMYRVLRPGGRLVTADIDRPSTLLGLIMGWGGRYVLLQPELIDNLEGRLPDIMAEAGFEDIRKLEHVHGLISFFGAKKPANP